MRLTDGAFLLVDAKEGVMPQTKVVLQQALVEGVQPVLVLNKFDKLLPDNCNQLMEVLTSILEQMQQVISQVNSIIGTHNASGGILSKEVSLESGSVCFGSGKQGWMTTLSSFARLYGANCPTVAESEATVDKVRRLLCGSKSEHHVIK